MVTSFTSKALKDEEGNGKSFYRGKKQKNTKWDHPLTCP